MESESGDVRVKPGVARRKLSPPTSEQRASPLLRRLARGCQGRPGAAPGPALHDVLLDSIEAAVIVTDVEGTVFYWNRAATRLFGWRPQEALGRKVVELTPDLANQGAAREIMRRLGAGESWSGEFQLRRRDGSVFRGHVSNSPIHAPGGELIGVVGLTRDLTQREAVEARGRGEALDVLAHDLRDPLQTIRMAATVLTEAEVARDRQERLAGMILDAVDSAAELLSRLSGERPAEGLLNPRLERVAVAKLLGDVRDRFRLEAREKGVELELEPPAPGLAVEVDAGQVERVLSNLVRNALDFTEEGRVALAAREGGAGMVRFRVRDTGCGIAPEHLPRVFEPFWHQREHGEEGGHGLGLSIAREIVRLHGGRISVESEPGEGTTFSFTVPRAGE